MLQKIKRKILITLSIAGILYLGFTIYADLPEVINAFADFNWLLFPLLLALSMCNYLSRFLKWDYYLSILKANVRKIDSFSIFMSGLIMSVTPGKMGELLKSFLVKEIKGIPVSKTAPIIMVERITDFVSLIIIAVTGAYIFNYGRSVVLGTAVFFVIILIIISNRKIAEPILLLFEKNKFLKKNIHHIYDAYESSYKMLKPFPLFYMTLLSLVSWTFECLGYYLILRNFGLAVNYLWAAFSYAFATIVGAISMLPGGLGVTEGSLTFFLIERGIRKDIAVASTFIIRVVTLWFAVLIGIVSVSLYQKRYGKITVESL